MAQALWIRVVKGVNIEAVGRNFATSRFALAQELPKGIFGADTLGEVESDSDHRDGLGGHGGKVGL